MDPVLSQEMSIELTSKKKKDQMNIITTTVYSHLKGLIPQGMQKEEFFDDIIQSVKAL